MRMRRRRSSDEMSLQITSMADIFTIILVFLLKSYATSASNIVPSTGTKLVEAEAGDVAVEALKVEVSETTVQVEGRPVSQLKGFRVDAQDLQANGSLKSLADALETERKRQNLISAANPDVKNDSKILIVADSRTPYSTLKPVLASAAIHGFGDFKLVVVRKE